MIHIYIHQQVDLTNKLNQAGQNKEKINTKKEGERNKISIERGGGMIYF